MPYLPVCPLYFFNRNRGNYYEVDPLTGALNWTSKARPDVYPFLAVNINTLELFWKKDTANANISIEYASYTDLVNSNKEFIQDTGTLVIASLVQLLNNKKCYTRIDSSINFNYFEQMHQEQATTVYGRFNMEIKLNGLFNSLCCLNG